MNKLFAASILTASVVFSTQAVATGLATCDVPEAEWQSQDALSAMLKDKGWKVRRIKVDGGCYEVYALDENGKRVEAYFNPKSFDLIPTREYGGEE